MKNDFGKSSDGISLYTENFLRYYDYTVLKFNCRYTWRCPSKNMLNLYNEHVSHNHLDIGPGTGYFLKKCVYPVSNPKITVMDLNKNCLDLCKKRLNNYSLQTYEWDALEPYKFDADTFDSVALMNLLHCLPGDMTTKGKVFENISWVLKPGRYIFGSTVLGASNNHSYLAKKFLKYCNTEGIFNNYKDDYSSLKRELEKYFKNTTIKIIGSVALFSAQK